MSMPQTILITGGILFLLLVGLVMIIVLWKFFKLWLQAYVTRAKVSLLSLIAMSLRKVNAAVIVETKIMAVQAGLPPVSTERTRPITWPRATCDGSFRR